VRSVRVGDAACAGHYHAADFGSDADQDRHSSTAGD
jgi:hypothetical protein